MIAVRISAQPAVVRAGLETIIRAHDAFTFAGGDMPADVWLAAGPGLSEEMELSPIPVIWLTGCSEGVNPAQLYRTGIRALLSQDASAEEIMAAIHAVAAGLIVLDPVMLGRTGSVRPANDSDESLTPREIEVLTMLADGLSNKAIAQRLSISEHTAKFHVAQILAKLQVGSRTEAVTQGIRRGLVIL